MPVPDARAIIPVINELLKLPFALKIASKDHHPDDHVSFARNHPNAEPFVSTTDIINPLNPDEVYETALWPAHCVIGTHGNELCAELDTDRLDGIIYKGVDPRVEMYSAFHAPLRAPPLPSAVSELSDILKKNEITHVFVVGLAGDYCVLYSALDCAEMGWETYVVKDAVRCIGGEEGWPPAKRVMDRKGVHLILQDAPELDWIKSLAH